MTTTPRRYLRLSRRSIKTRFAYRFLRALKKLNKQKKPNSNRVKLAAYASMASVVGSKRTWSRALLWKIRNRGLTRTLVKKTEDEENPREETGFGCTNELRKLVPGGEVMDFYNLLDETADYIKCLSSQVQVMRNILDLFSS